MGHFNTINEPTERSNRQLLEKIMTMDVDLRYEIIQKMSGLGNSLLRSFVESRGDTGGACSGARQDSVLTQYDAVWVPTFERAKLLHLQINPTCTVTTGRLHQSSTSSPKRG